MMDDLISRQAAIDHWRLIIDATNTDSRYNMGFVDGLEFCISHLSTMPSAQPEISCSEIPNNSDAISRQAAIDAIEEEWDGCCSEYPATQIIYDTTEAIERLPIIQPKRGKWIDTKGNTEWYAREYECSECGGTMLGEANFCPNCGADMRPKGEDNESD